MQIGISEMPLGLAPAYFFGRGGFSQSYVGKSCSASPVRLRAPTDFIIWISCNGNIDICCVPVPPLSCRPGLYCLSIGFVLRGVKTVGMGNRGKYAPDLI